LRSRSIFDSWGKVLRGHTPILSIEITRECPLHCPGCYAYGSNHLGGAVTLRQLADKRGDELVRGILDLADRHKPLHISLVGGEPMVRHRELSLILPELSTRGIYTMIVTSGILPIPQEWMQLSRFTVAVSVDGLPEHHDVRRAPATYEKLLSNIAGRRVYIHWTITAPMLERDGYLEEYVRFWNAQDEVHKIWVSLYSPQHGEESAERLGPEQRERIARELPRLHKLYPKLLTPEGYGQALLHPPASPAACTFSRLSKNYSADLHTRVEPCVFGGDPDCSQCGCSASAAAHWVSEIRVLGPLKAKHLLHGSMSIGGAVARLKHMALPSWHERNAPPQQSGKPLVQISID
jgi:MoaA/NifB/PqqE/SkfB family radical SAM enzyme